MILATEHRLGLTMGIVNQPVFNKELTGCRPQSGILILVASWPPTPKICGQTQILVAKVKKNL
jgi:hypothetical protein